MLRALLVSVYILHFLFLFTILLQPTFLSHKKKHKPLIVNTIVPKPAFKALATAKPSPKPAIAPLAAKSKDTSPSVAPVSKKEITAPATPIKKEPAVANKTLNPSKQTSKNTVPQPRAKISDALLKELEESIAKIENNSDKSIASKKTTAPPITLQIDRLNGQEANHEQQENDYTAILIDYLHHSLSLPEYGEVKIQLSLREDGSVAKVIVLKAQNEKNRRYLENNLPHLRFPSFKGKEQTFVLTFCNEF